jgi:hypothetical protein
MAITVDVHLCSALLVQPLCRLTRWQLCCSVFLNSNCSSGNHISFSTVIYDVQAHRRVAIRLETAKAAN